MDATEEAVVNIKKMSNKSKEVKEKIAILRRMQKECLQKADIYKKRYKTMKTWDDAIDFVNACLSGISIALIVAGFSNPTCLLASAIVSAAEFVISRGQDKYNLKSRYTRHNLTLKQYSDLAREISTVLSKNHMDSADYQDYIEDVNAKISLIEDSQII